MITTKAHGQGKQRSRDPFKRKPTGQVQLTDNDFLIFRTLAAYRVLNARQLAILSGKTYGRYFQLRLQQLFDVGLIDRIRDEKRVFSVMGQGSYPLIYALGDKGAQVLKDQGQKITVRGRTDKNLKLQPRSCQHDLWLAQMYCRILQSQNKDVTFIATDTLVSNATEAQQEKRKPLSMKTEFTFYGDYYHRDLVPDGLFGLSFNSLPINRRKRFFFVEIDTGSEDQTRHTVNTESIMRKMLKYRFVYQEKLHKELFNLSNVRVLFVTTTEKRIDNMIQKGYQHYVVEDVPPSVFLFTTFEKVNTEPFHSNIWRDASGKMVGLD